MATLASGAKSNTWLTINGQPLLFDAHDENQAIGATEYRQSLIRSTRAAPLDLHIFVDDEELQTTYYGLWYWKPEDYAGLYTFRVEAPGLPPLVTSVRVFPHKLSQQRYEQMNQDIAKVATDLLYCLHSPAAEHATAADASEDASPLRDYKKVKAIIQQMSDIMEQIRRQPYCGLRQQSESRYWYEVSDYSGDTLPLPGDAVQLPTDSRTLTLPQRWQVARNHVTYDVYEHRLLKHFLQHQLIARLGHIEEHADNEIEHRQQKLALCRRYHWTDTEESEKREIQRLRAVIADCQQMQHRCFSWCREPFLHSVKTTPFTGKATQVLQKRPGYSRFYSLLLLSQQQLKTSLRMSQSISDLALRKVSELYEMWSVFQITSLAVHLLLAQGYTPLTQNLFYEVEDDYFAFEVRRNTASIVLTQGERRVEFKYEPVYPNQREVRGRAALVADIYSGSPYLTPDMAIEVYQNDVPQQVIIFDAKYRYWRGNDGYYYPRNDNLNRMREYRDDIRYKAYDAAQPRVPQRLQRIVSNASILFPGNREYLNADGDIGALPLVPGMSPARLRVTTQRLEEILRGAQLLP